MSATDRLQRMRARYEAVALLCAALACLDSPRAGAVTFNPFTTVDVEHSSNVFSLPNRQALAGGSFEDTIARVIVGSTADFKWGRDTLTLNVEGSRYQYARNTTLSHYGNSFGGIFDWRLGSLLSGDLEYQQRRIMAAPGNTFAQELLIQTDRTLQGTFRVPLTPRLRFDLEPRWHALSSPLPLYPEFGYRETSTAASINYLGTQKLTVGVRGSYLEGAFHHIVGATEYNQKAAELTSKYAVNGFSSFDLHLGYTWRNASLINPAEADVSAAAGGTAGSAKTFTGALAFNRRLSVKTGLNLKIFRDIDSYEAGANPAVTSGGEGALTWEPDFRFALGLRYRRATQSIQGTLAIADFAGRTDRINESEASVKYQALHWLSARLYGMRFSRSSNLQRASYNATVVGIDFTAQLHQVK